LPIVFDNAAEARLVGVLAGSEVESCAAVARMVGERVHDADEAG
jgi:hypothetical protein